MSKNRNQKLVTPEIFHQAVIGSFTKLNPRYMMKNPVMFVVEVGCIITLLLSIFPGLFGDVSAGTNLRLYNVIVCELRGICGGRTRKSTGGQFEENPKGHQGTSFAGKWHGEGSPLQPAEER